MIALLLLGVFLSSVTPAAAAANMGAGGYYYYTSIVTHLWDVPINSINIGGTTLIDAESMAHYGFTVTWLPEQRRLALQDNITQKADETAVSGAPLDMASGKAGRVAGRYYHTDIVTTLNGLVVESCNIGGRTFISAEGMRDFGYTVDWDDEARLLSIGAQDMPVPESPLTPDMTSYETALQEIRSLWFFESLWEHETDFCMIIYGVQKGTSHGEAYMLQLIRKADGKTINMISRTGLGSDFGHHPLLYDFLMSSDDKTLYFSCDSNGVTYHFQADLASGLVTRAST